VFGGLSLISGLVTIVAGVGVPNIFSAIALLICGVLTMMAVKDEKPGFLLPALIVLVCF